MREFLHSGNRSRIDPHKLLWAIGALLVAIMAAVQVYDVLKRRAIVLETTERTYTHLAASLAAQSEGIILAVDSALMETANDAALVGPSDRVFRELLDKRVAAVQQLQGILVLNSDGKLVASAGAPPRGVNTGQFSIPDGPSANTSVLARFQRQDTGRWTLALVRRVANAAGRNSGLAVAFLDPEYFVRSYASVDLGPGTNVGLLDQDGHILASFPDADANLVGLIAGKPTQQPDQANSHDSSVARAQSNGHEITYAVRSLSRFPVSVIASVDDTAVLKPWNIQAVHSAVRTSLFCLSVMLLLTLVLRQLRRREQAESRLRVQTALLDELFESAPEGIVMLDQEQCVTRVNREFTRLFGFSADQALGRPLSDLIVPDEFKNDAGRAAYALRLGRLTSIETERVRRDGGRLQVSEVVAPITLAGTRIAGYAIYRDITERRLAEAERSKLESRLRQAEKLEAIGKMAGGIAHDFNSILTAILGYGEMARSAGPDTNIIRRYLSNVLAAANRAKALVDQILTYSRTTRGKHSVINPRSVVQETLSLVRASLPPEIELKVQLSASRTTVIADPTHIHQLVMNLCTNAAQAMRAGGILEVTLDTIESPGDSELSHGTLAAGHYVRLGVRDTGCGIAPDVLAHIFEPFFTTKEAGHGTGLGLALVQSIVSELGGAIDVTSQLGDGSTFHLYLPRSDETAAGSLESVVSLPRGAGERVLLVEDEKPLMLLAEEMLAALGYEPAGFVRARDAMDEFQADPSRFDAVVVDYLMPEMTGTELARQLRVIRSDIPVVLVSGYEGPVLLQEAFSAGIEHIITKPLGLQQLAEAMVRALVRISTH